MSSIRLRKEQIARLHHEGGARCIAYALKRWRRGDFSILENTTRNHGAAALAVYPVWRKPEGVTDAQLRAVLDAHWATPDTVRQAQLDKEFAYWDGVVKAEFAKLAAMGPYIIDSEVE